MNTIQPGRYQGFWRRLLIPTSTPAPPSATRRAERPLIIAAAIPSTASLAWTVWSLVDMLPAPLPVGLAVGGVLDVALVSAVAIAWAAPAVAKPAKTVGWLIAGLAAVLVGWHAAHLLPILGGLGLVPLVSKGLWGLALDARLSRLDREAEEAEQERLTEAEEAARQAELSSELSHEQLAEIARRRQEAAYTRELASAEQELERAQAQAAHEAELERIRRAAAQQREMDREDAEVIKERIRLTREIRAGQGLVLGSGEAVPDDLSALPASSGASVMGFGGVMGADVPAPRGASPAPQNTEAAPSLGPLEPRYQELLDYIAQAGAAATVRGAAKALGCDPASVRRRRDTLAKRGHDMSALSRRQ